MEYIIHGSDFGRKSKNPCCGEGFWEPELGIDWSVSSLTPRPQCPAMGLKIAYARISVLSIGYSDPAIFAIEELQFG